MEAYARFILVLLVKQYYLVAISKVVTLLTQNPIIQA